MMELFSAGFDAMWFDWVLSSLVAPAVGVGVLSPFVFYVAGLLIRKFISWLSRG